MTSKIRRTSPRFPFSAVAPVAVAVKFLPDSWMVSLDVVWIILSSLFWSPEPAVEVIWVSERNQERLRGRPSNC